MKNVFVETSNVRRFHAALAALEQRGAQEACLAVVDGLPGLGKTTTLRQWVSQNGAIYLRAKKEWTPSWFMNELLEEMRVHPPHSFQKKFQRVIQELAMLSDMAGRARRNFALVIDEADHISKKETILETVRDVSDILELPVVLVGMGKVNDHLTRFPQVASRVSQKVRFEKASLDDVRLFVARRCEVNVADDLVGFVHKVSQGYNREVLEAIANIEKFGLRQEPSEAGIGLADMAGLPILNDRHSGQPVFVPEML